ncbi:Electron transfer flavoprotein alpha-subunit [Tieghemiomyces parasiticus]|uniref:Probable electron transfer flavoprotein subunit alpha n=1 Tax=Tieghemiomyces parasiticus TaxID=78921 RepID=A0A9W8AAY0_9FUNG|nr:Electron transfer flavoprotein alpha-subunit [Tieghemiomyces parasiticus]
MLAAALRTAPNRVASAKWLGTRAFSQSTARLATLLLVEHKDAALSPATLNALTAAGKLSQPVTALVAGSQAKAVAESVAKYEHVSKVLLAEDAAYDHGLPEVYAPLVVATQKQLNAEHVVAAHTAFGKSILPRAAAILDVAQVSDITAVEGSDTFVRPVYAGNAIATVRTKDPIKIVTVRTTAFPAAAIKGEVATVEKAPTADTQSPTAWVGEEVSKSDRPELAGAKIVVSGGRAFKSKENFDMVYKLADALGAAVGASRAAVDAGYCDNSLQVGQTGKIVAPELYVALGISGAIQHLAGMKDSKIIVAVNKDPDCPIFQVADYGLVGDIFKLVPELTEKVAAAK